MQYEKNPLIVDEQISRFGRFFSMKKSCNFVV